MPSCRPERATELASPVRHVRIVLAGVLDLVAVPVHRSGAHTFQIQYSGPVGGGFLSSIGSAVVEVAELLGAGDPTPTDPTATTIANRPPTTAEVPATSPTTPRHTTARAATSAGRLPSTGAEVSNLLISAAVLAAAGAALVLLARGAVAGTMCDGSAGPPTPPTEQHQRSRWRRPRADDSERCP